MNVAQLIAKKRDGEALSVTEWEYVVHGYVDDLIPDYQLAALAMAIHFRGMTETETVTLTQKMVESGATLVWPSSTPPRVDKHSTGGLGDKVSLLLAPMLACCDVQVPMLSGRGLGLTGGTLDKLEAIPGLRTDLSREEIVKITGEVGCVICGASEQLVPADRRLYALRDVTATVAIPPLIVASILSKKLAEGLDALVLDVKVGAGGVIGDQEACAALADRLVTVGQALGLKTTAVLTNMEQPLGSAVGNAVEVWEALETLEGGGPEDLRELSLELGSQVLNLTKAEDSVPGCREQLLDVLDTGRAREKFGEMVRAQGGDLSALSRSDFVEVPAPRTGFIEAIRSEWIGQMVIDLGGGRKALGSPIDHSVGLELLVKVGSPVEQGQPLCRRYGDQVPLDTLADAFSISPEPCLPPPLVLERRSHE